MSSSLLTHLFTSFFETPSSLQVLPTVFNLSCILISLFFLSRSIPDPFFPEAPPQSKSKASFWPFEVSWGRAVDAKSGDGFEDGVGFGDGVVENLMGFVGFWGLRRVGVEVKERSRRSSIIDLIESYFMRDNRKMRPPSQVYRPQARTIVLVLRLRSELPKQASIPMDKIDELKGCVHSSSTHLE
jgi:hypothetical protein